MTSSELKRLYLEKYPKGSFFSRRNMKFTGDSMKNFGVRDGGPVWILYRKTPVKYGMNSEFHFDKVTFRFNIKEPERHDACN